MINVDYKKMVDYSLWNDNEGGGDVGVGEAKNRKELSQNHWKYYLMLEKRFIESIEYVELDKDNFNVFSN